MEKALRGGIVEGKGALREERVKGKESREQEKVGLTPRCYNCWGYGHVAADCPMFQYTTPGLPMPGQPKGAGKGKEGKGAGAMKGIVKARTESKEE